jgi:Protein of unknown function (DUF4058)
MPLLNHFQAAFKQRWPWESFHSAWANWIVNHLNQKLLPPSFWAIPHVHMSARVEVDVATIQLHEEADAQTTGNGTATAVWAPPQAALAVEVDFADQDAFEVQIRVNDSPHLVAAVELVSPANKDRPSNRRDFAVKCAGYLQERVAVVIVDAISERRENLHVELMRLLDVPTALAEAAATPLYAVAYRMRERDDRHYLELWPAALAVGTALPTLPLWISNDQAVPLDLEASYLATCTALRIG